MRTSMPENRPETTRRSSSYRTEEAFRRLKIEGRNDENDELAEAFPDYDPVLYPVRPGEADCIYYLRTGTCGYGSKCRFNHPFPYRNADRSKGEHPERHGEPECTYYMKTGTCKYGTTCKYHHPGRRIGESPVSLNILGLPIRQGERSCPFYMRTGDCKFGAICKFHHPHPTSAVNPLPVLGSTSYDSNGSAVVPSSFGVFGAVAASSLPKSTYISAASLQVPQTYMPVFISPSQGWSTYVGSIGAVASSSTLADSGSNRHDHRLSSFSLPERPGQPECRNFLNRGSCKFGSECKYNHPREKIVQSAPSMLSPLGLPMRPGQAICSHYTRYGLCKYGPTCKFDHPLSGYSYQYAWSFPSLGILDPSQFPYQMSVPQANFSGIIPLKSSKVTGWFKKGGGGKGDNEIMASRNIEELPDETDSLQHFSETSSDHPNEASG